MKRLATVVLTLTIATANATELTGRVVGVTDGDTITVLAPGNTEERIRLAGIDAPEKNQPYGQASKQHLSDQVFDRQVVVDWAKRDQYGRIIGKVLVDGRDANLEQVKAGLAWHYKKYQNEQELDDRLAYGRAEVAAREARTGLWEEPAPVAPWEWRKR